MQIVVGNFNWGGVDWLKLEGLVDVRMRDDRMMGRWIDRLGWRTPYGA